MRVRMRLVVWHLSGQEVADASLAHAHAHRQVVDVLQLHDLLLPTHRPGSSPSSSSSCPLALVAQHRAAFVPQV